VTEDQYVFLFTHVSDIIQLSCEYLLSDLLIYFPDFFNSWWYVNELVLNTCEGLGYISEHCN